MTGQPDPKRLDALEERLEAVKERKAPKPKKHSAENQAQAGWRMVTELVVGILLGLGIGYGLDTVFGTLPWLMIIFLGLGFAAGIRTMMRTAAELQEQNSELGIGTAGKDEMYDDD